MIKEFGGKEITPYVEEYDRQEGFPLGIIQKVAGLSLMGAYIPERYGGTGLNYLTNALLIEWAARYWQIVAMTLSGPGGAWLDPVFSSMGVTNKNKNSSYCSPERKYSPEKELPNRVREIWKCGYDKTQIIGGIIDSVINFAFFDPPLQLPISIINFTFLKVSLQLPGLVINPAIPDALFEVPVLVEDEFFRRGHHREK
jgi:hypothetical protein